ncbi:MAG: DedA family protein [Candidatus Binatia bacterium]
MDERILNFLLSHVQNWGYYVVFVMAFLETSAFVGLLVPGESVIVIAGLFAASGALNLTAVIGLASAGAILGDSVGYLIGYWFGESFFRKFGRYFLFNPRYLDDARRFFAEHGGKTVFLGRFVGYLRAFAPVVAGMSRMPYLWFVIANVCGGVVWAVTFSLIGYFVGNNWVTIEKYLGRAGVVAFAAGVVGIYVYVRFVRRRQRAAKARHSEGR